LNFSLQYHSKSLVINETSGSRPSDANLVTRLRVIGIDAFVGLDQLMGWSGEINFGVRMNSEFIQATARFAEERVVHMRRQV
jgi:hypothetical protein